MTRKGTIHHDWSDDDRDFIRTHYTHTIASKIRIAELLSLQHGKKISMAAVSGQISRMGIAKRDDRRRWTPKEKARLAELIPRFSVRQVAQMMHRSLNSVVVMSTRIHASRRVRDGWFTKNEVCEILGMDHKRVQRRIDSGVLKASYHYDRKPTAIGGSAWHIDAGDLAHYIRTYPEDLNSRNCDMIMIVELIAGINGKSS